ncbi:MAG: menaquinone biosynthesis protein [Bacteroidales bacterium]|jgi:chorismate dehydratase|nr:menaquinone biosynthesis protein [Bacteroidales bacterium]
MKKIKISTISFINTIPFIFGIKNSNIIDKIDLIIDHPAACADKLVNDTVDIGLVPVASIPNLGYYKFISDYCIGATNKARTVVLVSNSPINEISTVFLDSQSRSSVTLVKILADKFWKINPIWKDINFGNEINLKQEKSAAVIIGDKVFDIETKFRYKYDLAQEWTKYTKLPFVFATWIANKEIDNKFLIEFNNALKFGVANINNAILHGDFNKIIDNETIKKYLTENISYSFDNRKKQGMELFLKYMKTLN